MTSTLTDGFGLTGQRLDGKYEIESVVAQGGFAVVYRATHLTLRKSVAVKVLRVPPELEGSARVAFLEKFALEAQTIAALDHPAIVKVLDFGTSPMPVGETAPWMVLEWIQGVPLDVDLEGRRGNGGRTPAECLTILRPVFEALAYAHDEGIAHRDVKPGNLMLVTSKRGDRTARVLDFGIAKTMNGETAPASGLTATHNHGRTFSLLYASPEQIAGTRTGPWTDVYALGLVLAEMLTDTVPYRGDDVQDVYIDALSPVRPTPAKHGFDAGAWEAVLARAVALKPAERFASAREFLAALDAVVPARVSVAPVSERPSGDTLSSLQAPRGVTSAPQPPVRGARRRAVGYALLGALGMLVSVASYRVFSPQTPQAPVVVRVEAQLPEVPVDAAAVAPVIDAGAPDVTATVDASAPALVRVARPVVRVAPRVVVVPPRVVTPPRPATGHEIIPAE